MERLIISAPFGNYLNFDHATSTIGTYTKKYRGGFLYRLWRMARTLRYDWRRGSWINRLGLPNPGIGSLDYSTDYSKKIISIHGFNAEEWENLAYYMGLYLKYDYVELNLSCPNVGHKPDISEIKGCIEKLQKNKKTIIAKLPPIRWMDWVDPLFGLGVNRFHCFNTIPGPHGGSSGKILKLYSLWGVEEIKNKYGDKVDIISGGGITCLEDVKDYTRAGADRCAIGSMCLNPLNLFKIKSMATWLYYRWNGCNL